MRLHEPITDPASGDASQQTGDTSQQQQQAPVSRKDAALGALGVPKAPEKKPDDDLNTLTPEQLREQLATERKRRADAQTALRNGGGLRKPADDSPQDEKDAYRAALRKEYGAPERVEDYGITAEGFKDVDVSPELLGKALAVGAEHGIPKAGLEALIGLHNEAMQEGHAKVVEFTTAQIDALEEFEKGLGVAFTPGEGPVDQFLKSLEAEGVKIESALLVPAGILKAGTKMHMELATLREQVATLTKADSPTGGAKAGMVGDKERMEDLTRRAMSGDKAAITERDELSMAMAMKSLNL